MDKGGEKKEKKYELIGSYINVFEEQKYFFQKNSCCLLCKEEKKKQP